MKDNLGTLVEGIVEMLAFFFSWAKRALVNFQNSAFDFQPRPQGLASSVRSFLTEKVRFISIFWGAPLWTSIK